MRDEKRIPIRIMTRQFQLLCEIKLYESLQITRRWHGIGVLEMRMNRYKQHADKLQRGNIIFPHNQLNKGYVIRHKEIELDENGKITENWVIRAYSLKTWFGDNLTMPPVGHAYDSITSDGESVMHHYALTQAINPYNPADALPVVAGINLQRGDRVEWQSRYKNLAEEMAEISLLSGIGWNVDIDTENNRFVFNTLAGRDLTDGQSINPPAIFSTEFKTLKQLSYVESELDFKNVAVVAGQGEGVDRRIVTVGDLTATGLDRRVLFVDARDVAEETEDNSPRPIPVEQIEEKLRQRGLQKLAEHQQEIYLEGQALTKSRLVYQRDWDLGDIVTLQNRGWGVTLDARVTEVKEIYEPVNMSIEPVFGNSRPTLISKIKKELAGMRNEMVR